MLVPVIVNCDYFSRVVRVSGPPKLLRNFPKPICDILSSRFVVVSRRERIGGI